MKGKANRKEQVYAQKRTEDIDWGCMDEPDVPISGKQQRLMMRTEISHEVKTVDEYGNDKADPSGQGDAIQIKPEEEGDPSSYEVAEKAKEVRETDGPDIFGAL